MNGLLHGSWHHPSSLPLQVLLFTFMFCASIFLMVHVQVGLEQELSVPQVRGWSTAGAGSGSGGPCPSPLSRVPLNLSILS